MHIVDIGTFHGTRPSSDLDLSAETLLRLMDQHGVAEALTCALKAIQFDVAAGNDETMDLCQRHPNLHPVAVVDPRQYPACLDEVERCARAGVVGFRLLREYQGWAIDNQAHRHTLRAIAQTDKPAIVHTPASGDATVLLDIAGGWDIPVVLAAVSYAILSEALAVVADAPNFCVEAHRVILPGQVEAMVDSVGAERMMFGSWAPQHSLRPSMDMVLESEVNPQDKALILGGTARRVFGLGEEKGQ